MEFEWTDVKDGLPFALAWFRDEHATGTSDDMLVEALNNGEVSFEFEDEETGETILHYIVKYDQAGYLDETENWEDCVNVPNKRGETPLYYAIEGDNVDVAKRFIDAGADLDIKTNTGDTYLHVAAQSDNLKLFKHIYELNPFLALEANESGTYPDRILLENGRKELATEVRAFRKKAGKKKSKLKVNKSAGPYTGEKTDELDQLYFSYKTSFLNELLRVSLHEDEDEEEKTEKIEIFRRFPYSVLKENVDAIFSGSDKEFRSMEHEIMQGLHDNFIANTTTTEEAKKNWISQMTKLLLSGLLTILLDWFNSQKIEEAAYQSYIRDEFDSAKEANDPGTSDEDIKGWMDVMWSNMTPQERDEYYQEFIRAMLDKKSMLSKKARLEVKRLAYQLFGDVYREEIRRTNPELDDDGIKKAVRELWDNTITDEYKEVYLEQARTQVLTGG